MNTTSGTGFKMKHAVAWYQSRCLLATQTASQTSVSKASHWIHSKFSEKRRVSSLRDFGLGNLKNCCSWHLIRFFFFYYSWFWNFNSSWEGIELLLFRAYYGIMCYYFLFFIIFYLRLNVISLNGDNCFKGCVLSNIRNCKGFPCFLFFDTVFLRNVRNHIGFSSDFFFNFSKLFELWIISSIQWDSLVK